MFINTNHSALNLRWHLLKTIMIANQLPNKLILHFYILINSFLRKYRASFNHLIITYNLILYLYLLILYSQLR